jgi:putative flippase GtrA
MCGDLVKDHPLPEKEKDSDGKSIAPLYGFSKAAHDFERIFMIDTFEMHTVETSKVSTQPLYNEQDTHSHRFRERFLLLRQLLRFGLVGGLNTLVDLLSLNGLLWLFPTTSALTLLIYSSLAFSFGAVNSFLLNKYWTFGSRQKTTSVEVVRFVMTTLCGIIWSSIILWLASNALHPFLINTTLWANASKVIAIAGTALINYLGMRLWVFVSTKPKQALLPAHVPTYSTIHDEQQESIPNRKREISGEHEHKVSVGADLSCPSSIHRPQHSLSIVLPAYNEEAVIGGTLEQVLYVLEAQVKDFEIIVVNDGSTDNTGAIIASTIETRRNVRVVTHERNQGYGATLVDGFATATKELTFFMDSDGQFDIRDLARLLAFIDEYDAVIGYRKDRQDTLVRKLNARGWNLLIRNVLGVQARDIDCAFKLLHTSFLHEHPLETRGAMINAELLYKLKRAGYTYREVEVRHLPRRGGRATGANLSVIVRAFRELFIFARKWRHEERAQGRHELISDHYPF